MRKVTSLITLVLVISVIPGLNSNAVAQDQTMHPQMHQNLHEMSMMMADISNQLNTGKMSPDAQKAAALITKQMSQIFQELSKLGDGIHYSHKKQIDKMKKAWDPFATMEQH